MGVVYFKISQYFIYICILNIKEFQEKMLQFHIIMGVGQTQAGS
jgi:hypothetical protein